MSAVSERGADHAPGNRPGLALLIVDDSASQAMDIAIGDLVIGLMAIGLIALAVSLARRVVRRLRGILGRS